MKTKYFTQLIILLLCIIMENMIAAGKSTSLFPDDNKITLSAKDAHDMLLNVKSGNMYEITVSGIKPYILSEPVREKINSKNSILSFEYFCPRGFNTLQIFFGRESDEKRFVIFRDMVPSEGWVLFSLDLGEKIGDWGKKGDVLRFDFGAKQGVKIQIRDLKLRIQTKEEIETAALKIEKKKNEALLEKDLKNYLSADYTSEIKSVSVTSNQVLIKGVNSNKENVFLCEVPPYQDVTEEQNFASVIPVTQEYFKITTDRFVDRGGFKYDRLLSKWVLALRSNGKYKLLSHAFYADQIEAKYNLPDEKPRSRKGLGGFDAARGHIEDLEKLNITSVTVNVGFTKFMYTKPAPGRIEHDYNGKSFYFNKKEVENLDSTLRITAKKNIIVAAILLVNKTKDCSDPEIGKLLQYPDCDPSGIYSMPNMTNLKSVECYAAALDFLASRYSRPDEKYGRINHWIMHNEVDAGWVWTNAGDKKALVFMDTYIKSMRMCYNIARSYNPYSQVFVSITHYWAWTSDPKFYPSKDLMNILLDYSKVEGDFQWAMAQHPYPEDLFEPKTWNDPEVTFDFNTPLITFKNLEVLNEWIQKPEALYKGKYKRTLWLSENGTNSKDYSEQNLREQAAGFAYTWKKLEVLKGIDAFQWHNWIDSRGEGGLRIGLRRFPDDENDPGGAKPVWYVYQAADTKYEDSVFDQYKKIVGINDWDEIKYTGPIDQHEKAKSFRDIKSDTWVATDALGRSLPDYNECGPVKADRFVGIFYFLTHNNHGGSGPFNVTKILKDNPENPEWGEGSHYWGEPEIGYYLNTDEWAIRRHANQLSDAGIDVLIFDVTNDVTYPEDYLTICKVFRKMRAQGEKTPSIAFLGSEISVNKLWEDFYKKAFYPDLWFMWKGKPLILFGQHEIPERKKMKNVKFSDEIRNFFSIRYSWAWTSLPWYNEGKDDWPWVDHYPQAIGWHDSVSEKEMVPVAVAEHPLSNIGRSFHNFYEPDVDKYDVTPYTDQGLFFQEEWSQAIDVQPEFVFVTGWNEWSAGRQVMGENINQELLKWKFYPGAHLGKPGGRTIKTGESYFIDQYNEEFSRDIEPMTGGYGDDYYYQLVANVRKYKGVEKPVEAGEQITININGGFEQWNKVQAVYYDHIGDTEHRNYYGEGQAGPYIDTTGRNDIKTLKVARDDKNIYFYAETNETLSSFRDPYWMLLFIDIDQNKKTGWNGYDFLVNSKIINDTSTTIAVMDEEAKLKNYNNIPLKIEGNKLMLAIPKDILGIKGKAAFDFHWADNIQKLGDINEFFLHGDSAPDRRSNYRFNE
jgi:hypothetical protein